MTERAYKLAALFFFIIGVTGILAAMSRGVDRAPHSSTTVFYLIIGITGLSAAGAVRLGGSRNIGRRQISNRTAFWVVFLTLVLVCLGFLLPVHFRRQNAVHTCDLLRPLISADARFKSVDAHPATNGRAIVSGTVNSAEDAAALRRLIAQTRTPQQPIFLVRVLSSTNDNAPTIP